MSIRINTEHVAYGNSYITVMVKLPGYIKFHIHALVDTGSSYGLARQNLLPTKLWKPLEAPLQVIVGSGETISLPTEARNIHLDIGGEKFMIPKLISLGSNINSGPDLVLENEWLMFHAPVFKKRSKRGDEEIPPLETLLLAESWESEVQKLLESTCSKKPLEWWHKQKPYADLELLNPNKEIREKPMVYTPSDDQHKEQLLKVLNALKTAGIALSKTKLELFKTKIDFLGLNISKGEIILKIIFWKH
ncbi:uncharacterized protein [Aristolochia californica]|uniref:uncharacterized protein n=1 Tax=Aristolochia californica TaxID=171875 RepID=UPI0035DE2D50